MKKKIIVILGPTSSGKSEAAIRIAKKFNGEIISADSRQIYCGLDIGTGKISRDYFSSQIKKDSESIFSSKAYYSDGVPHHLIDIVSPKTEYNVSMFKRDAQKAIEFILSRGKNPIICGGTGFWIGAVVDDAVFPEVKPDWILRKKLEKEPADKIFKMLKKMDPERAMNIDAKNKVRLIRAIEVCKSLGKVPKKSFIDGVKNSDCEFLQIGIEVSKNELQKRIRERLNERWKRGMVEEVKKMKKSGLSWKKIQSFGLGYFWIPLFLKNKISEDDSFEKIYLAEKNYAKRQMTWFKKDKRVIWLNKYSEMEAAVKKFMGNI